MWRSFCETLRDCGQNAALFIFLLLLMGLFVPFWNKGGWAILPALMVFCLARVAVYARQHVTRARLGKLPLLSQNEKEVARSKLMRLRTQR